MDQIKTPITQEQFESVCQLIETTDTGTDKACSKLHLSPTSFREYMRIVGDSSELRYARAKAMQVEVIQDKINELQEECKSIIMSMEKDDRRCNAIQSAFREQIRHLEWVAAKLKPGKYGDKIDVTTNGESISRELTITSIPTKTSST